VLLADDGGSVVVDGGVAIVAGPQGARGEAGQVVVLVASDGGSLVVDGGVAFVTGPSGQAGAAGQSVVGSSEPTGSNCAAGGVRYDSASGTAFVCNASPGLQGPAGPQGDAGLQGLPGQSVTSVTLAVGDSVCPRGGTRFTSSSGDTYACSAGPEAVGRDDPSLIVTGSLHSKAYAGTTTPCVLPEIGATVCIEVAQGPLVLTDLGVAFFTNSSFPGYRVFAGGADPLAPTWARFVDAPALGVPRSEAGLNISVRQGEKLFVWANGMTNPLKNEWFFWSRFGGPAFVGRNDPSRIVTASVQSKGNTGLTPCVLPEMGATLCIEVAQGPMVITDLSAAFFTNSSSPGYRMFVAGADPLAPAWTRLIDVGVQGVPKMEAGLNISLRQGQKLFVWAYGMSSATRNEWFFWSGFRP
jgi:hypothetical protein